MVVEAHLQQRHVEAAAVEGEELGAVAHPFFHQVQLGPLVLEAGRQELAHGDTVAVDARAADQECLGAGAAGQPGGLEVDDAQAVEVLEQRTGRRGDPARAGPGPAERRKALDRRLQRADDAGHGVAAVAILGAVIAIDDDATAAGRFAHGAAEDRRGAPGSIRSARGRALGFARLGARHGWRGSADDGAQTFGQGRLEHRQNGTSAFAKASACAKASAATPGAAPSAASSASATALA